MTSHVHSIGVAIDVGDSPGIVLNHAVTWARHLGGRLTVVTVSDDPATDIALAELGDQLPDDVRGSVKRLPPASGVDDAGGPDDGDVVTRALDRLTVEMLIVGTHARTGVERLLLGSVAEHIVRDARVPVLVCPLHAQPATAPLAVACLVDPDEPVWDAVRWVTDHLEAAVHVLAAYPHETAAQHAAGVDPDEVVRHRLEEGLRGLDRHEGITLHGLPGVEGDPSATLAKATSDLGVDLVAVTSHQRHGFERFWYGSVAEKLMRTASRAVLVHPMPEP